MSFLKCCVGADPRPPPEAVRPVGSSSNPNRRHNRPPNHSAGASAHRHDSLTNNNKKLKLPTEVFFDPSKPDGQLSSVTDPPHSARELRDAFDPKKKKEGKDRTANVPRESAKIGNTAEKGDLDAPDNNGLTRGQNFMKVEKWLRNSCMYQQVDITPGVISNLEDLPPELPDSVDPPSEKDRLPPAIAAQQASARSR